MRGLLHEMIWDVKSVLWLGLLPFDTFLSVGTFLLKEYKKVYALVERDGI